MLLFVTILMSLKDIVPNEIKQTQSGNTLHDLIYLIFSFKEEFKYADAKFNPGCHVGGKRHESKYIKQKMHRMKSPEI